MTTHEARPGTHEDARRIMTSYTTAWQNPMLRLSFFRLMFALSQANFEKYSFFYLPTTSPETRARARQRFLSTLRLAGTTAKHA
jgi:hypothetical protein